jgi:hypothetical protein
MRTASVGLLTLALALAFGCSSSDDPPGGVGGTASFAGSAGSMSNNGNAGQSIAGSASGGTAASNGGTAGGGLAGGGNTAGVAAGGTSGGGSGSSGMSNGGAKAGAGGGGQANGGSSGSGGAGGCVKNLACKLSPPASTGDLYQDCVDRINQFLTQCACLPALARRTDGEACANQMAEYDASKNSAHAGAIANICQPGGSQNECPGYASNSQVIGLCMQQMWDEGPPPTSSCTGSCYEEHGHFINMTDPDVTKVACGFYTTSSGKVWAVQNFSR